MGRKTNPSNFLSGLLTKVHDCSTCDSVSSLHPVSASVFFDEFLQVLENVVKSPEDLVISRDFNLHLAFIL